MVFEDRKSAYPNRYLLTDGDGNTSYVVLERADEPVTVGTPLSAETFNGMQEEIQIASEDYPGCFYRMLNDVEYWINPPMETGKRYVTTEYYNGVPVKVAAVEMTLTEATSESMTISSVFSAGSVIGISGAVVNTTIMDFLPMPYYMSDSNYCTVEIMQGVLYAYHSAMLSGYTLRVVLRFI